MMLRPTFLTAARCAASNLSRTTVCLQRPLYPCLSAYANQPHSVPRIPSLRWYSAPAGLAKEEVQGRIIDLLKNFDKVKDSSKLNPSSHFVNDLGLDSLDTVEVVMAIEEEFSIEIPDKEADAILSIDKAVDYIQGQPDAH